MSRGRASATPEGRPVEPGGLAREPGLFRLRGATEDHVGDRRDDDQRVEERSGQHEAQREDDGPEHLALDVLERGERQEHEQDDDDPEEDGPRDVLHRVQHVAPAALAVEGRPEVTDQVLDDDHRALDHDAEVDRAERHHVARVPDGRQTEDAAEHRERDRAGDDQPGADAPEREQERADDEQRPLGEVLRDRAQDAIDEVGAVVVGVDLDPGGQVRPELGDRVLHAAHDVPAVLALEHEHAGADDLAATVPRHRALARRRAGVDLAELADAHGRPVPDARRRLPVHAHERRGDVLDAAEAGVASQHHLLAPALDEPAARGDVVALERVADLLGADRVGREARRVEGDPVLLDGAPVADHVDHPAELPQAGRDLPLDDGPELLGRALHGARRLELEHVDLAERRGHGPELRHGDLGRDRLAHADEALVGLGAGEVEVDVVVEDEGHERDPQPGHAARELEARDARHGALERLRDLRLDLRRRESRRAGDDLHLHVRHVGDGVDGDACEGHDARDHDRGGEHQGDEPVRGGPANEALHWRVTSPRSRKAPSTTMFSPRERPSATSATSLDCERGPAPLRSTSRTGRTS